MAEYIERETMIQAIREYNGFFQDSPSTNHMILKMEAEDVARDLEAADIAPVVHGRWEWITEDRYRCNNCGRITRVDECMGKPMYSGCPYCRAKMDLTEG